MSHLISELKQLALVLLFLSFKWLLQGVSALQRALSSYLLLPWLDDRSLHLHDTSGIASLWWGGECRVWWLIMPQPQSGTELATSVYHEMPDSHCLYHTPQRQLDF